MFAPLLAAFAIQTPLTLAPPVGVSQEYHALLRGVSEATAKGDWAGASALAAQLPIANPTVSVEVLGASPSVKDAIEIAFERAVGEFTHKVETALPKAGRQGEVAVRYASVAATKTFFGDRPERPRASFVFPLTRPAPKREVTPIDVSNDAMFALARYYGVAASEVPVSVSGRTDAMAPIPVRFVAGEAPIIRWTIDQTARIKSAIASRRVIQVATGVAVLKTPSFTFGATMQGEELEFDIKVANTGRSELVATLEPDCGCITTSTVLRVAPGAEGVAHVTFDTTIYNEPIRKSIFIATNDPTHPRFHIPIAIDVQPRYRVILPPGRTFVRDRSGDRVEVYLLIADGMMTTVKAASLSGMPGKVRFERWTGDVFDPESGEILRKRAGYKFTVDLGQTRVPGRVPATINLLTNDGKFERLGLSFNVQQGLVLSPESIFMGEVGRTPTRGVALISRPGFPFKITGVQSSTRFLRAHVEPRAGGWEYKIVVEYLGTAPTGDLAATVRLTTDDPARRTLELPVSAVVR